MTAVDLQAIADGEAFQDDLFDETAFLGGFKETMINLAVVRFGTWG